MSDWIHLDLFSCQWFAHGFALRKRSSARALGVSRKCERPPHRSLGLLVDVLNALAFAAEAEDGGTEYRISKNGE